MKKGECSECGKPLFDQKEIESGDLCDSCYQEILDTCDHLCSSNCRKEGCNCVCGEWHIGKKEVCEFCGGSGEVSIDVDDGEGHSMRGVGTRKCVCQVKDMEEDIRDR